MSDVSLLELFREEVRGNTATLSAGLVELEGSAHDPRKLEPLMRAAHSLKGAARIVDIEAAVRLAHAMEDVFVAAQEGKVTIDPGDVDVLLRGTDVLATLAQVTEASRPGWGSNRAGELTALVEQLQAMASGASGGREPPDDSTQRGPDARRAKASGGREPPDDSADTPGSATPGAHTPGSPQDRALVVPIEPIPPGDESPLWDLFREELRQAALVLTADAAAEQRAEAAHAIRGAARLVQLDVASDLAAAIEEAVNRPASLDAVRDGVAALVELLPLTQEDVASWTERSAPAVKQLIDRLAPRGEVAVVAPAGQPAARMPVGPPEVQVVTPTPAPPEEEAVVRVTAQSLSRLMSLAGESLVQARWLQPFSTALLKLKKHQDHLARLIDALVQALPAAGDHVEGLLEETRRQTATCRNVLAERAREFDDHAAQAEDLNTRLYREVIASRMRPFGDGAHGLPRLVRDMARALGKQVKLDVEGLTTEVDRDILERLEAPLMHLVRNAIDHGMEPPEERRRAGKPEQGTVRVNAHHRAGMLAISVSDDGGGIDLDRLREKVVQRGLSTPDLARGMSDAELLEFLFLPGFTTAPEVTEYSGRGVGLDVVQDTVRKIGGSARVTTRPGAGTTFHLMLPVTLSVLRAVLVTIGGEPYAFPHNRIDRLLRVPRSELKSVEHRQFISVDGHNVGLAVAAQLFDLEAADCKGDVLDVLLFSDTSGHYGLVVEALRGEQDLVVRPLDPRLGKVPNVSAAAVLDDGQPVLIADVEDLIRSMDVFIQSGSLRRCDIVKAVDEGPRRRVLVVDDSITVREVERQLLRNAGYDVSVAVDGADGWNQARAGDFDLIVTDVDMPRMTGLQLVQAIRSHDRLADLPVIIVSYKDRPEDRRRGLELGANQYLTKSSFHDDTFLQAVADLIGDPGVGG